MVHIAHARINEKGKTTGGTAGDQTGKEVTVRSWYSKPWQYYIECLDDTLGNKAADLFLEICNSNLCGYSQSNRLSLYQALAANGGQVSGMKKCEADCSSAIAAIYSILGLNINPSCTTRNIRNALLATGKFKAYSDPEHISSDKYARRGSVYLKEGSHIIMAVENGSGNHSSNSNLGKTNSVILDGQKHAVHFTGIKIQTDGILGKETNKMKAIVLQHALNLDYGKSIDEDGYFQTKSQSKLGKHYVKKGETQYLVTAAEILMELNGITPKGVEYPGIYGNGLTNAAKTKFGGAGTMIDAAKFLKLIS